MTVPTVERGLVLLNFKESGELHEAYKEQIQSTLESDTNLSALVPDSAQPCKPLTMRYRVQMRKTVFTALEISLYITKNSSHSGIVSAFLIPLK